ncbi:MAG: NAD(P)H-hydrate epimerase [Proteobacteria bacterium]|nr:NAD(P)H-hydrate epimerase [Pseudomonadota bacterium]
MEHSQILTVAQMRMAEDALIAAGATVESLMDRAGKGAADWVWRIAAGRAVTVLVGPGNNGGDGWVLAEALRARGCPVAVVIAHEPRTPAAIAARAAYQGAVLGREVDAAGDPAGAVLVDCLFGSGLARPLAADDAALLTRLAASHPTRIAVDLPSGVDADSGAMLNPGLPDYALTLALGAWKAAHYLMPAAARMGALRLVDIGCADMAGAARVLERPALAPPPADAHKYRRGLLGMVAGAMPGAAILAARAAQGAGAGYVKVISDVAMRLPPELVWAGADTVHEARLGALLVGPGLGRHGRALATLREVLGAEKPLVLDADALMLLDHDLLGAGAHPRIATPHEGELAALEQAFGLSPHGSKVERATALAGTSGMVLVAKGPDTVIAAPDGRVAMAPRAPSWLSVAGTGDVLAGTIAARLAAGVEPFTAAAEGVWLHGEAARLAPVPFTAMGLAETIPAAYRACL